MKEPGTCKVMDVIGWLVICISGLAALFGVASGRISMDWLATSGIVCGILFLVLSAIARRL